MRKCNKAGELKYTFTVFVELRQEVEKLFAVLEEDVLHRLRLLRIGNKDLNLLVSGSRRRES
jgi:nitrate/nitrite-specific signal transduction histidine kinase